MRKPPTDAAPTDPAHPALIHAGELARLAGLHKTTVLLAVRRGELKVSRTVGRSVRIAWPEAVAFLEARGVSLAARGEPAPGTRSLVVLSEQTDVHPFFARLLPAPWSLAPRRDLYEDLLSLSVSPPGAIVLDLDLLGLNPLAVLRALRSHPTLGAVPALALSRFEAPLADAEAHGARVALRAADEARWREAFAALA